MARKLTYRHPQPRGFVLVPVTLPLATWKALEGAIGHTLTDKERGHVATAIQSARNWRHIALRHASTQDVRATLAAISKMSDADAMATYDRCDVTTRALLWDGLFVHGAETIKTAAAAALAHFPKSRRGPHRAGAWQWGLADAALRLWGELGGAPYSASVNPGIDYSTPPVRFGVALFAEVQPVGASRVRDLLTSAQKREGTNIR
jgi:hypothetical protein